jgi:hypothetical protein
VKPSSFDDEIAAENGFTLVNVNGKPILFLEIDREIQKEEI